MTYVWQRWLADEFRKAGLKVVEVEGWKDRGRPASTGHFDPTEGVATHHTGWPSSAQNPAPGIATLVQGRPDLPGPLCQWATAYDGTVYVIAAGRANVNGRVGKPGVEGWPLGADGNAIGMGNEVITNGTQPLSPEQRHSIAVTNRVVLDRIKKPEVRLVRHEDISGTGKWDLGSLTTQQIRDDAAALKEDDMADPAIKAQLDRIEKLGKQAVNKLNNIVARDEKAKALLEQVHADLQDDATRAQVRRVLDILQTPIAPEEDA